METDILIAGSGCSGLYCALHLPRDKRVTVVTKADAESSDSYLAQGGICCLKDDNDYDAFFEDTLKAGHYENDRESVDIMIRSSQAVIDDLIELGVDFQRETDGIEKFQRPAPAFRGIPFRPQSQHAFGQRFKYRHAGVERGEGILKDDLCASAQMTFAAWRRRKNADAVKRDAARNGSSASQETERGERRRGLARARFADERQCFAGIERKRDSVDGRHGRTPVEKTSAAERDAEIVDLQKRLPAERRLFPMNSDVFRRNSRSRTAAAAAVILCRADHDGPLRAAGVVG